MSVSRVKALRSRGVPGVILLIALVGVANLPAAAQDTAQAAVGTGQAAGDRPPDPGPPTLLVPRENADLAPGEVAPATAAGLTAPAREATAQPRFGIQGIVVNPLEEIDPDSIGILGSESGGFGADMWRGSSRAAIERLLPRLPGVMASPAMRSLAQRLLLSSAEAPRRRGGSERKQVGSLLAQRVERLAALGNVEGLNGLLKVVPQRLDDESLARARVEGLLLAGDAPGACEQVRGRIATHHDKTYWRKALVFCQIHSGEVDQAMLGVGLMREQGLSDDPTFYSLVDAYTGAEVAEVTVAEPLHLAMLDAVPQSVRPDLTEGASPGILVGLARSPAAELDQRALAGERAAALGMLSAEALTVLYEAFDFAPDERDTAVGTARETDGPRGRALLYQAARDSEEPSARAELLRVALQQAKGEGLYHVAVRTLLPMLEQVPVEPGLVWFAETAARALYAAGRYPKASEWVTLARQEAIINPEAAAAVMALWPYSRLAGTPTLTWSGDLETWRQARADDSAEEQSRLAVLRSTYAALGASGSMNWIDLVPEPGGTQQAMPDATLLYALERASEMRRPGETVLLGLLVLGEPGPAESHPLALNAVLRALREVGLERDARALAIEAAIAKGV